MIPGSKFSIQDFKLPILDPFSINVYLRLLLILQIAIESDSSLGQDENS